MNNKTIIMIIICFIYLATTLSISPTNALSNTPKSLTFRHEHSKW